MEQSPKFNRNWIYFKKSSKIILLHLSDLQYIEYCFNQPKGHFGWKKMHEIHPELGGNGVFTSAQPSLKLQSGIPFSMVTNRILGNSLSSFQHISKPIYSKGSWKLFNLFYPSLCLETQYLGFTIRGSIHATLKFPNKRSTFSLR